MRRKIIPLACSAVFTLFTFVISATAGEGPDWKVLFDGKSTNYWRAYRRSDFPSKGWKVEDGILKTIPGGDRVDLITRDQYENFELELEWRVSPGGNSGIIYRASEELDRIAFSGPEMQILDDERHQDGKNPKTSAGALYALIAPANKKLRPVGEFNHARLIVQGNHVEHWLNGVKVVEYELGSDQLNKLIAESKFKDSPRFAKERRGYIALQYHGDEVWFRSIRIRELPAPPNQLTLAEEETGWKLLFDGKSTKGWRGFKKDSFPNHRWAVEDGCLKRPKGGIERDPITGGGGNDIITTEKFGDFDLRWEWKISPAGNSGVKYFISEDRIGAIGHEYQLIDDDRHPDARHGPKRATAALYDLFPAENKVLKAVGEFNQSRILVEGNHVQHWLNGVKVLEYELGSDRFKAAIAQSKFTDVAGFGAKFRTPILLQDHGDEVWFRSIKIRELQSK